MQRSTTQVLFKYLPDAVFMHDEGFIAEVSHVGGANAASRINRQVLLEQLAEELSHWTPDQVGIPNPLTNPTEFVMIEPEEVSWDVFPLTFECTNHNCKRVVRWFQQQKLLNDTAATGTLRCQTCGSKLRQLRYVTAHNCGQMQPLHTPTCSNCGSMDHMWLEDLGSFASSPWKCRGCGASIGTRFTPCGCGLYGRGNRPVFQQGYTPRDQRLWSPQTLTILNISAQVYNELQQHPQRGAACLASWLGDESNLAALLQQLAQPGNGTRMSADQWADQEAKLRSAGTAEEIIAQIRTISGPADVGVAAVQAEATQQVLDMAGERPMVERAGLFDVRIVDDRKSFAAMRAGASGAERTAADTTAKWMGDLGIEDISVTQQFPIVLASYGYTRCQREPGRAHLRSYAKPHRYDGKTPIFTVPAKTEALLVTYDARAVLGFLVYEGDLTIGVPTDLRDAKLALAEILAADPAAGGEGAAGKTRRLVHSASHALVRALDDGQSGFGESSLAEWIVPNALTSAVYVASYEDFTLGAFDTVLRRRLAAWLSNATDNIEHCDNDPMCSQVSSARPHAACDRCLHLSFGCRLWNADLDRRLLRRFWHWTQQHTPSP